MRGSTLLPRYIRDLISTSPSSTAQATNGDDSEPPKPAPSWLNRKVTRVLCAASHRVCLHPIHTIVVIALLASTTYIGLLEGSLVDSVRLARPGTVNVDGLLEGGRSLRVGPETGWKWVSEDIVGGGASEGGGGAGDEGVDYVQVEGSWNDDVEVAAAAVEKHKAARHLALTTFIFPHHSSNKGASISTESVRLPANVSVESIPATPNLFAPISQDSSLAFAVPYDQVTDFLRAAQEIPQKDGGEKEGEQKKWIMKAARSSTYGSRRALRIWAVDAYSSFVDLIMHAETIDIIIMSLGYLSMNLTIVSLFSSMRRLGSKFWLAATVLFKGMIAFLFALLVTTKLGVPISLKLLSEGVPFLVVTIGFEKPIILTKAVLSANVEHLLHHGAGDGPKNSASTNEKNGPNSGSATPSATGSSRRRPNPIQGAIQTAIQEKGFKIFLDYVIEIGVLVAGALSDVQGGLRQFCFLASWILFFDGIMLFTFYTTILCIKLEINRIKRHVALRRALEEEGVTHRVAENVAAINDNAWPPSDTESGTSSNSSNAGSKGASKGKSGGRFKRSSVLGIFGKTIKASSVPKFKALMIGGFVVVNLVNLFTIPFKSHGKAILSPTLSKMSELLFSKNINPFKVAERGLEAIYTSAQDSQTETVVTVLAPIKYALEYPSVHYHDARGLDIEYSDQLLDALGGKVIESLLKSLEDPVISKWIIAALTLSVALNGYLFNAARWSLTEPATSETSAPKVEDKETAMKKQVSIEEDRMLNERRKKVSENDASLRSREECEQLLKEKLAPYLQDEEIVDLAVRGKIPGHALEKTMEKPEVSRVEAFTRAVKIRRAMISRNPLTAHITGGLESSKLPFKDYNYTLVHGACCENVVGYLPVPLGLAGPLNIDGRNYFIPMATTEGVLVASLSRGCKAINAGGGANTVLTGDGMTRGPCVSFPSLRRAGAAKIWLDSEEGQTVMRNAFNSTSRFARLQQMKTAMAGTYLYIRFKTTTGDAMGMNMISKGVEKALQVMSEEGGFEDMTIISVSGNYCMDKKPAAINWIDGRGKSVVAEATIPGDIVKSVLRSDVDALVELNTSKNLVGSAMSGSIGGFNAHASNIVTAIFIATGQDPAQNVESSNCITLMKNVNGNLQITVSMPSVEVGTIGGGTILEAQSAMLDLLGVRGAHPTDPGENARMLARIVAAAVLAGELNLCSALAAGHLVKAHMAHNRSQVPTRTATPVNAPVGAIAGRR